MSNLIVRSWNGRSIRQREDGYLSATDMAQANGKLVNDWLRLKSTVEYLREIEESTGIPANRLVEVNRSAGVNDKRGTWVHPLVFDECWRWFSSSIKNSKSEYIYLIGAREVPCVKIGVSADCSARLKSLQTGFPYELKLLRQIKHLDAKGIESLLHTLLKDYKLHGEWFDSFVLQLVNWDSIESEDVQEDTKQLSILNLPLFEETEAIYQESNRRMAKKQELAAIANQMVEEERQLRRAEESNRLLINKFMPISGSR